MVEETFLPDPKRRLALRVAAVRMLERERERIERLQIEGKLTAEGVPTTSTGAVGGANGGTESHGCAVDPTTRPSEGSQDSQTEGQDGQPRGTEAKDGAPAAGETDTVLIAGKGHENYQEIRGVKYPFSDLDFVAELFGQTIANPQ